MIGLTWKTWVCRNAFYFVILRTIIKFLKKFGLFTISLISFAKSLTYFIYFCFNAIKRLMHYRKDIHDDSCNLVILVLLVNFIKLLLTSN
jgi:hypothetical protein